MPRSNPKARPPRASKASKPPAAHAGPPIRDPRPECFASDATAAIHALGFPCTVAAGGGGLAVYASRSIQAGEEILVERPLVLTISHESRKHICAHCLADSCKSSDGFRAAWTLHCNACNTQHYCSAACASAAAPRHSGIECAAMASAAAAALDTEDIDTVTQAIRMLCDRARELSYDCGPPGPLASGPSHASRLVGLSPSSESARECLQRICTATLAHVPEEARIPPAQLLDLLERHSCNLYGVTGEAGEDVAGASFAGFFHLFNHSCSPNAVFDSARQAARATAEGATPLFALRALFDVFEGGELCISYTSSADGAQQRRQSSSTSIRPPVYGQSCRPSRAQSCP